MKFREKFPEIAKGIRRGTIILLLIVFILSVIWWIFGREYYILDLSFSISDVLQLIVILIALFGPLMHNYVKKRSQIPIVTVNFQPKEPFVFIGPKNCYSLSGGEKNFSESHAKHYCVTIKNTGKSRLRDCEVVLVSILSKQGEKFQMKDDVPQIPLKWVDGEFRNETIDINPGREQRAEIFFFASDVKEPSPSEITLKITHASDDYHKLEMLGFGEYILEFKVFSENADIKPFDCLITFDKGEYSNDHWHPECVMEIIEKEAIQI